MWLDTVTCCLLSLIQCRRNSEGLDVLCWQWQPLKAACSVRGGVHSLALATVES